MKQNKTFRSLLSVFLTLVMLFQVALPIFAAGVDSETASGFTNFLGDNASTEYAGRIWTDRSVHSSDVVFHTFGGGTATVKINEGRDDEEFLISYSALSTTHSVVGKTQSPVDVVFIIDVSGSMKDSMGSDSNQKRIAVAAQSLNKSIDTILGLNDYTRVGVVAFSENAVEFLPLGRYEKGSRNGISNYFSVNFSGRTAPGRHKSNDLLFSETTRVSNFLPPFSVKENTVSRITGQQKFCPSEIGKHVVFHKTVHRKLIRAKQVIRIKKILLHVSEHGEIVIYFLSECL